MVKLNYANRKSEGVKLGQIVAKDMSKKAETFWSKSTSIKDSSPLELNLAGRKLGADGVQEVVEGLQEALTDQSGAGCFRLEELNLSGNDITTAMLPTLAQIIRIVPSDLRDLDLSGNKICVKTEEDAHNWEIFLYSFRNCHVVRRIDFSGNQLFGPKPFEVLLRVYSNHPTIDAAGLAPVQTLFSNPENHSPGASVSEVSDLGKQMQSLSIKVPDEQAENPRASVKRQGLRSIPYLVFSDVSMTDSGALHYSQILERHYHPQQLMRGVKPSSLATVYDEYHKKTQCWGLIHFPNGTLTATGEKLLYHAEAVRQSLSRFADEGLGSLLAQVTSTGTAYTSSLEASQRRSSVAERNQRLSSNLTSHQRHSSTIPAGSGPAGSYSEDPSLPNEDILATEEQLVSVRKRIERIMMAEGQLSEVQLWRSSLRLLVLSRVMFAKIGPTPKSTSGGVSTYASDLVVAPSPSSTPIFAITSTSNQPTYASVTEYGSVTEFNKRKKQPSPTKVGPKGAPVKSTVRAKIVVGSGGISDPGLPMQLPMKVWRQIILCAAKGEGVVSEEQQDRIIAYAQDRASLEIERGFANKNDSIRMWRILEAIGCLTYQVRE
ncbi:hypothetical protein M501DRAFT_1013218 [Patellaria atrata CBS 101060]|uniref:Leucine rich repeat protein n=1 Tax=Patellaria atrata CBS 101060 TaxID=1346257 RepID=A0A9P4VTT7_9PEZI|nr:hypothetical protein M501DRAFT_1013218 [Patellaria atrata CBS 101060]